MRRIVTPLVALALLAQLAAPALANVENPQWVPQQPTTTNNSFLWNYRQFFPGGLIENVPQTVNIVKIGGTITGPTCQNPGFLFNFQNYVAQLSQIKAYVLSEIQSAMQAAPLLLIEALFPELADILKHLNHMTWLQLGLQHDTCQSMMNFVNQNNLVPSLRPYTDCLAVCMGPKGSSPCSGANETRDQAEVDCSATAALIYDPLNHTNVPTLNLMSTLLTWAQNQRNTNGNSEVPNDTTIATIAQLTGELTFDPTNGRSTQPAVPVRQVYKQYKMAIKNALNALLAQCISTIQAQGSDDCFLSQSDLDPYAQYLSVQYPLSDQPTWLIDVNVIRAIAAQPAANQPDSLDLVANAYALAALRAVAKGATYVTQLAYGQDGMDEYTPALTELIAHIDEQLDEIANDQTEREKVTKTNYDLVNRITQANTFLQQQSVLPGKPIQVPLMPQAQ